VTNFSPPQSLMRRYFPFVIVAAVGSFTLGTGTMLCWAKRLPVLAIPKNTTAPETAGTESVLVRGEAKTPAAVGVNSTPPYSFTIARSLSQWGSPMRAPLSMRP
jgi:hypothetical protein